MINNNKKNIIQINLIILFLNIVVISMISILERNITITLINFLFIIIFSFLLYIVFLSNDKDQNSYYKSFLIFNYSLIFNLILLIFFSYIHELISNEIFIVTDEINFLREANNHANLLFNNLEVNYRNEVFMYDYFLTHISYLSKIISEMNIFNGRLLSVYFGSMIPVLIYYILDLMNIHKNKLKISLIFIFFPWLNYFSIVILRDILVAFVSLFIIYLILKKNKILDLFLLFFALFFLSGLRERYVYFMAVFIIFYIAFNAFYKFKGIKKIIIFSLILISVFFLMYYNNIHIQMYNLFKNVQSGYWTRTIKKVDDGSIGAKLFLLPFPFNLLSRFIFGLIGAFPFWRGHSTRASGLSPIIIYQTFGHILYYYFLLYYILGTINDIKQKKYKDFNFVFINIMILALIFVVTIINNDIRRYLSSIYLIVAFGLNYHFNNSLKNNLFNLSLVGGFTVFMTIFYLVVL